MAPDLNPEALVIKDWERHFATQLFPFIPSPRSAKRFTNIYRILKAPLSARELQSFEGTSEQPGEFQAVMLLLAVATGHSSQAVDLFREICASKPVGTWRHAILTRISLTESQKATLSKVKLGGSLAPFITWAPRVARFTFEAAKALAKPIPVKLSDDPVSQVPRLTTEH